MDNANADATALETLNYLRDQDAGEERVDDDPDYEEWDNPPYHCAVIEISDGVDYNEILGGGLS